MRNAKPYRARPGRASSLSARLRGDERGAIAIYVAVMLPFLVGLAILVVDGGRLQNLDTSLQNNVDALALAAAAELDRRPDSHVRACRAMAQLVQNSAIFATGDGRLQVACTAQGEPAPQSDAEWRWLRTIPPDHCSITAPSADPDCGFEVSDDPGSTFYIAVTSRRSAANFSLLFPVAFIGGSSPGALTRTAVAGMSRVSCQPTPIMLCNPWEGEGAVTVPALRARIGRLATAREYGGGAAAIGPGEFGLVNPAEIFESCKDGDSPEPIVQTLTWQLAGRNLTSCQVRNGVCPKTGVVATLDNAVNSRFDIYDGAIGSYLASDPSALVPAARTIWSSRDANFDYCRKSSLKREVDGTTGEDTTPIWYSRATNWDRAAYFQANNYFALNPSLSSNASLITLPDGRTKTLGTLTRYETYLWETSRPGSAGQTRPYVKPADRTCYSQRVTGGLGILNTIGLAGRVARRELYASIVNCQETQAAIAAGAPYSFRGASTDLPLPTAAVVKFFITEPINRVFDRTIGSNNVPTSGPNAWPTTGCIVDPLFINQRYFSTSDAGALVADRTYFLNTALGRSLEATIPAGTTATAAALVAGFNAAALTAGVGDLPVPYAFCEKNGNVYVASSDDLTGLGSTFRIGVSVAGANKQIIMELADVYAADNGGDVTRDIVRLYR